jgi:hypothetical protein
VLYHPLVTILRLTTINDLEPYARPERMTTTPQTIYGDETGFSGNNLLDESQPYFVYCTVAVSHERAGDLVNQAKRDFRLDNPELKGQKLVRHARGRKAITGASLVSPPPSTRY